MESEKLKEINLNLKKFVLILKYISQNYYAHVQCARNTEIQHFLNTLPKSSTEIGR